MKKSLGSKIRSVFGGVDRFKTNVKFRENNKEEFSTCFGTLLSFFILFFVLLHGNNKFTVMKNREDTRY